MKRLVLGVVTVVGLTLLSGVVAFAAGTDGNTCVRHDGRIGLAAKELAPSSPIEPVSKAAPDLRDRPKCSEIAFDTSGRPVEGRHDVQLRYFKQGESEALWIETFKQVEFVKGSFEVVLGEGDVPADVAQVPLKDVFAANPVLEVAVEIDGAPQFPRILVQPAGHSAMSRAVYAGAVPKDGELHTKGFRSESVRTGVQAVTLRPKGAAAEGAKSDGELSSSGPFLIDTTFFGISQAVRDMPPSRAGDSDFEPPAPREVNPPRHETIFDEQGYRFGTRTEKIDDPLAPASRVPPGRATPSLTVGFEGIDFTNVTPPDPEGAVGLNHYTQVVNSQFQVFDKSGNPVTSAVDTNSLWSSMSGSLCEADNYGDAIFLYDEPADRWVLSQFTSGNVLCFAISTTDDPTGTYYLYEIATQKFPDYYKVGVWPDPDNNAYFIGTNTGYQADYDVYAIDRENMLQGIGARSAVYFQDHPNLLMPADLDGDTLPPSGQPGIFYTFRDGGESYFIPSSSVDTLDIWEFDIDWSTPANSTFGIVQQIQPPELADFNWTVCGFFTSDCLPQPNTTFLIDSASWWPMQRLQYRNFGAYETLVGTWTVDTLSSGDHAAPRWFEMRRSTPTGNWSMAFQGTQSPDSVHRWMGSVALDGSGNMGLAYSKVDGTSVYPSLWYATRARDAATFDAEAEMVEGLSYYTDSNYYRWGDYASMEVDPADDCTFWYTGEYIKAGTSWNWSTYIGAFKVPGCTGTICDEEAPTGLIASSGGANAIDLVWTHSTTGGTGDTYIIYRSLTDGGPYAQVGTTNYPNNSYTDSPVSADATYYYVISIESSECESFVSNQASASTSGTCTLPPLFDGLEDVSTPLDTTCTLDLTWSAATPYCSGATVTYDVYRDSVSGFDVDLATPIATGVTGTSYSDTDSLVSGDTYYYVVRAVDSVNGLDDGNDVEMSGVPYGPQVDGTYQAGGETGDDPMYGTDPWGPTTARSHTGTYSYNSGYDNNECSYLNTPVLDLTVGQSSVLTYWSAIDAQSRYDGGVVELYDGTGSYITKLTPTPGYPSTFRNTADACGYSNNEACYSGTNLTFVQYTVDLSAYNGSSVIVAWFFSTNGTTNTGEGWYIDDVSVTHVSTPGTCTTSGGCTDPDAVSLDSITDDSECAQDGVTIIFSGGAGASQFDLWVDGSQVATDITSPYGYNPGDSSSHSYVVRGVDGSCFTNSGSTAFTDADNTPVAPAAPSVGDDDACAQDGVTITWGAVTGADGYDLRIDGATGTTISGVSSPYSYDPGDSVSHTYEIRAIDTTCGAGAWSGATAATDEAGAPGTPTISSVNDASSCGVTGVAISWGAVGGATSYDLLVDGTTTVTGVSSPYTYLPGDGDAHNYQVRAVNICGNGGWSTVVPGTDQDFSFTWAGIETAADRDACDDTGVALRWSVPASWGDGGAGSRTYNVLRDGGTIASGIAETTIGIDDISGVNGTTYDYGISAVNGYGCTAGSAAVLPASDQVGSAPTFAGVQSVTQMPGDVCGLRLEWAAGTSNCVNGPTIVYNVYRSQTPGFTPDATTLYDSCVADLYYEDHSVLGGNTYYYVVRAEDSSLGHGGPCGNGFEDTNTVQGAGTLSSGATTVTVFEDDFDGTQYPADYWNLGYTFGNPYTSGDCSLETMADDWHLPEAGGTCTANKAASNDGVSPFDYSDPGNGALILGDPPVSAGPPFTDGGILLPSTATSITLTFNHDYDFEGSDWDGGRLMVSVDDWPTFATITPVGGYPGTTNSSTSYCHPWPGVDAYIGDSGGCVSAEFDLTAYAGQRIWLAWNHGADNYNTADDGWFIDDVEITAEVPGSACSSVSDPVQHFAARATSGTVKLEWQNPASGAYGATRVCVDTSAFPTDPDTCTQVTADRAAGLDAYDTVSLSSLTNNQDYYYTAFVDNGSGDFSPAETVMATPFDTSGVVKWAYHTSATALAAPGLYPGAAGTGAAYGVSNDRVFHSMNSTDAGGDWPRTSPFDWMPMSMNGPAQSRPPIVPTTVGTADLVAFLGSQDGHVYAVNGKTGETLWQSEQNYGLVQGAPAGSFAAFGGLDLIFAGSRVAGSGNAMHAMHAGTGLHAWSFGGTMGIISSGATVDYANNRLYFTSRENASGSLHTLWCLAFNDTMGSLVWSKAYGDIDSAPVLFDGVLYIGTNAGVVAAIDPATGDKIWSYNAGDGPVKGFVDYEFQATPRKVFFATDTKVWALTDNGSTVAYAWDLDTIAGPSIPLTLADQGAMYVGSTDGRLYQVDTGTGGVVTSIVLGDGTATVGSPGYDYLNSLAYVGAEDGSVYAVTLPLQ